MLPKGTFQSDVSKTPSYGRIMGGIMVATMVALAVGQFVAFLTLDACEPLQDAAGNLIVFKDEIVEKCKMRLDPSAQAAWSTATGGTLTVAIGWLYRETKRAEVANGG
jgi:hypothetical protein